MSRYVWLDLGGRGNVDGKLFEIRVDQDYGVSTLYFSGGFDSGTGYTSPVINLPYGFRLAANYIRCIEYGFNGERRYYAKSFPDTLWVQDDDMTVSLDEMPEYPDEVFADFHNLWVPGLVETNNILGNR